MQIITNWKAKRAGGRITVYGQTMEGGNIRIAGVDQILAGGATVDTGEPNERRVPVAIDKNGAQYALA